MTRFSKPLLVIIDAGLLVYWFLVIADLFPESMRFRDYSNEVIQAWNWSFFPLDVAAALMVFAGTYLTKRAAAVGDMVLVFGLTLTFCAGFMAISFWAFYGDFEPFWWGSNALLMIVPLVVFAGMVRERLNPASQHQSTPTL